MKFPIWLVGSGLVLGTLGAIFVAQDRPATAARATAEVAREVRARHVFGMQFVPKFDEKKGQGAWNGTRDRGIAMHKELGVQVSREGFIWRHLEPERSGVRPHQADFDDVVNRLGKAGIAMQAMVTE